MRKSSLAFVCLRRFSSSFKIKRNGRVNRIFISGAAGQVGSELTPVLEKIYGEKNIFVSDTRKPEGALKCQYENLDVLDFEKYSDLVQKFKPDTLIHLPAILSANGEKKPFMAINVNIKGFENAIRISLENNLMLYSPSTIAVFGPTSPKDNAPNDCILQPQTVYGITKVFKEQIGRWFYKNHHLNYRALRYPGIISPAEPGGGTTDYAVDIYYAAIQKGTYNCFLSKDSRLPMMYIDDMITGTINFLEAEDDCLSERVYNFGGISFTPEEIAKSIQKYIPDFTITYNPDFRQKIADSWPRSLDDSLARKDWGWSPKFDLDAMTRIMLKEVSKKFPQSRFLDSLSLTF